MVVDQALSIIPKKYIPIIAGVAAAIIAIGVIVPPYLVKDKSDIPVQGMGQISIPESMKQSGDSQTYKINTQCEMLFAMIKGQYPDGETLPRLEVSALLEKYPDEFSKWKDIFANNETRKAFLNSDNVTEFNQALIPVMMKESVINPALTPTAMLLADPEINAKIKQVYNENNCQEFFDSHNSLIIKP